MEDSSEAEGDMETRSLRSDKVPWSWPVGQLRVITEKAKRGTEMELRWKCNPLREAFTSTYIFKNFTNFFFQQIHCFCS